MKTLRAFRVWAFLAAVCWAGTLAAAQPTGLLYFASYPQRDNPAPAKNPHLVGALFTIYWSDVEKSEGVFDWSGLERRMEVWTKEGKKIALRIMWSSSGNWPEPAAKHPTPQFVLEAGAVTAHSVSSKTDIPLPWDPVYRKHARRFLAELARKFDGDPNILFVDVTPGAETNPYRFRRINANEPEFKHRYAETVASDGRKYSHELWLATVKQGVDDAVEVFHKTPLLVTLNTGSIDGPEQFQAMGDYCVSRGCLLGQNGLNARSYDGESARKTAFQAWGAKTKFYFEMVDAAGSNTGSLLEVMKAAERIGCSYLGVYAVDVLRGTTGQNNYEAAYEEALAYGAKALGKAPGAGASAAAKSELADKPSAPAPSAAPATPKPAVAPIASATPQGFQLTGETWTFREGDFEMGGILLKPEGKGPFPAVLISHGLGGAAENFGLNKAREMVKWGLVCMAPNYTHSAKFLGGARPGAGKGKGGPPGGDGKAKGGFNPQQYASYGASDENLKRARKCIELMSKLPEVDGKRMAAYGHSMGGFVTIGLAAAEPGLLKVAAVSGSGVAPQEGFPAPSAAKAEKIRTPFLMLHGGADTTVRPAQSEQLKAILDKGNVANERHVFEGEPHPVDQTQREEVFRRIREWFTKHGEL